LRFYLAVLLFAAVMTGCLPAPDPPPRPSSSPNEAHPVWWSRSELAIARLSDIDGEMAKPFEGGLAVTSPAKEKGLVADCATAIDLQAKGLVAHYPRDIALLGVLTAKCLTLDALKTAKPARVSYMPTRPYGGRLIDILPAALAPASTPNQRVAIERATAGGQPIRMVEVTVGFEAARDEEILITGEGWQETLIVLARGDFDGDGKLDWLLRTDLAVERGTHRISRLFLISSDGADKVMRMVRELKPGLR
jgi:hypothetical protein